MSTTAKCQSQDRRQPEITWLGRTVLELCVQRNALSQKVDEVRPSQKSKSLTRKNCEGVQKQWNVAWEGEQARRTVQSQTPRLRLA